MCVLRGITHFQFRFKISSHNLGLIKHLNSLNWVNENYLYLVAPEGGGDNFDPGVGGGLCKCC